MTSLDIRTLSLIAMISSLLLAVGLQIVNRVIAKDPSLRLWALGASANGAAFVLLAARGLIPDLVSIVAANTLLIAGAAWLYLGNRRFAGRNGGTPWHWVVVAVSAGLVAYFSYLRPDLSARIVVVSAATAMLLLPSALVLLAAGDERDRGVRWFVASAFLLTGTFLGARAVITAFTGSPGQSFLALGDPIHTFALVAGIAFNLMLGIGLPLLVSGRMQQRLAQSETRDRTFYSRTPVMLHSIDAEGRLIRVSDLWLRTLGYAEHEVIGRKSSDFLTEASRRFATEQVLPEFFRTGACADVPYQFVTKDGRILDMLLSAIAERDTNQRIVRSLAVINDVTVRHHTEAALVESESRFRGAFEAATQGMALVSPQGRFVKVNAALCAMTGYTEAELLATDFQTITHPDDLTADIAHKASLLAGRAETYQMQKRYLHKAGHTIWVLLSTSLVRAKDGQPVHFVAQVQDISEQKHAEERLRRNHTLMQSILDNIPVGLSAFDSDLHLIAKNRTFQTLLDFPDVLFDGPVTSFESIIRFNAQRGEYGPGDHAQTIETIVERARHPEPHQFERVRPNGVALEVRGAPMPGGGFVTTYADTSERKRAQAEIERTTAMLQSVLNAASEVSVIAIGVDGLITVFNSGAERMLGYTASEMVGQHSPELFHDPDEIASRAAAASAEFGRSVVGFDVLLDDCTLGKRAEWTYIRKDGSRLLVALVVTALTDHAGQRAGYLGIGHDIGTEKAYEGWLRGAMEEAEAATLAKSQFLANMSHEIRTPMNAILGMLKLLHGAELTPRQLDYASKAKGAARSLLGLLNDILDFSKIDAGKMELDPQPFPVDRLLRELSVILSANVGRKPVEVLFDIDPTTPTVLIGDAMRLQQVLINLSGNAIKFTAEGEVVIQIKVLARHGLATTLRFSVRDTGIGIAPQHHQHIFEGFSQAETSTTRRYGGTGLGLSISKRLVTLMGGQLTLDSALGEGSTFHFTITLLADAPALSPALDQPLEVLDVLVVDDHAVARELLAHMAQSCGWRVDVANGGLQAIEHVQARAKAGLAPYQALFIDWQMPGMDGWETIDRLRRLQSDTPAPITVMVTALGRDMLTQRSAQEQARLNAFLVKPVTASMLCDAIADARAGLSNLRTKPRVTPDGTGRLAGVRLLVVEDNLVNQQVARELLGAEGALVELADNGQLGVAAVAAAVPPFDAVLMDIQMPVMDGYDASRAIRHELGLRDLPVIAMTANAMASDRQACLDAGMNDHVGKPIDLPHLIEVVLHHIRRPLGAAPASPATRPLSADAAPGPGDEAPGADGVDVAGALSRMGGNSALFARVLQTYLSELPGLPDQFDRLLQHDGLAGASRLLHTVKGLSATVGAGYMAGVAKAAESELRNTVGEADHAVLRATFREAVARTSHVMGRVAKQFVPTLPPVVAAPTVTTLDHTELVEQVLALRDLLNNSDMAALEAYAKLHHANATLAGAEMKALDEAMTAFDFAQGVVQCDALIRKFGPHASL